MELQALRYAAMVSSLTFEDAVGAHAAYWSRRGKTLDARRALLEHLGWNEPDDEQFAQDVRIVLVSAEFSKELTTTVLWLNERELDIRCIRLKPYSDGQRMFLDVQQLVPLPEAADYQVRVKKKKEKERESRKAAYDHQRFDITIGDETDLAVERADAFAMIARYLCQNGVAPEAECIPGYRR